MGSQRHTVSGETVSSRIPRGGAAVLQYTVLTINAVPKCRWAHFSRVSLNMEPESPNLIERYTNNPANLGPPKGVPNPPGGRGWHVVDVSRRLSMFVGLTTCACWRFRMRSADS